MDTSVEEFQTDQHTRSIHDCFLTHACGCVNGVCFYRFHAIFITGLVSYHVTIIMMNKCIPFTYHQKAETGPMQTRKQ